MSQCHKNYNIALSTGLIFFLVLTGFAACANKSATPLDTGGLVSMVWVPGGSFEMGKCLGVGSDINPVHTVSVSGFYMGKYQVTQELYQNVMGYNPSYFTAAYDLDEEKARVWVIEERSPLYTPTEQINAERRPVESVSWYDAIVFCNRLSSMEELSPAYRISGRTMSEYGWHVHKPCLWTACPAVLIPFIIYS